MPRPAILRPLTQRESDAIRFLLSAKPPERFEAAFDTLREQVAHASVVGQCECGCPTVDLAVNADHAVPATGLIGEVPLPVAEACSEAGPYQLLLFVGDGWLRTLELVAYDDGPPPPMLPSLEDFDPPTYAPYL